MRRYVKLIEKLDDMSLLPGGNNRYEFAKACGEAAECIEDLLDDIENRIAVEVPCDSCVYRGKIKLEESPCKQCRYRVCIMETMDSIDGSCRYIYDEGE